MLRCRRKREGNGKSMVSSLVVDHGNEPMTYTLVAPMLALSNMSLNLVIDLYDSGAS